MDRENLLHYAGDGTQGYPAGSFWDRLMRLTLHPAQDRAERFNQLYLLFKHADANNLLHLNRALPSVYEFLVLYERAEFTHDQMLEILANILDLLPVLLTRFLPLTHLIDGVSVSLDAELNERARLHNERDRK